MLLSSAALVISRSPSVVQAEAPRYAPGTAHIAVAGLSFLFESSDPTRCVDDPIDWVSSGGVSCATYETAKLCTRDGGYGEGWSVAVHGTFEDWANGGRTAVQACCVCGGGVAASGGGVDGVAVVDPRLAAVVHSAGAAHQSEVAEGASSSSTLRGAARTEGGNPQVADPPKPAPGGDDESMPQYVSCAWDRESCNIRGCCRGFGMQCFRKNAQTAMCLRNCSVGGDSAGGPWSCEKLGPFTGPPGGEETCDPGRVGSDFWNGMVFRKGAAETWETCSSECSGSPWCKQWVISDPPNQKCFMSAAPVQTAQPQPWRQERASCRLAAYNMPIWNCSASGEDCQRSRCCKAEAEQCYSKDQSVAVCKAACEASEGWSCEKLGPRICPQCALPQRERPVVVIPTFERDLCKATVLAKSLSKRDPRGVLGDVFIMWVSEHPAWQFASEIDEMKRAVYSSGVRGFRLFDFSSQLVALNSTCIAWTKSGQECRTHMNGWYAQQSLKLKAASLVPTNFYLLLDSKNAFVSDVQEDSFFSECNQARVFGEFRYDDIPNPHDSWYAASASKLKIEPAAGIHWPTSITPAILHKETVLDMLRHIGEGSDPYKICDGPLCQWFGGLATEFTMYNLYAFARADRGCIYSFQSPVAKVTTRTWGVALWRGFPKINLEKCERVASGELPLTFGVQAGCLIGMSNLSGRSLTPDHAVLQRTSDCIARIFDRAGLLEAAGDEDKAHFTVCVA